jgi:hypothetical protein
LNLQACLSRVDRDYSPTIYTTGVLVYVFPAFITSQMETTEKDRCRALYGQSNPEWEQLVFVYHSHDSIDFEAARGRGQFLGALAALLGCSSDFQTVFDDVMQQSFNDLPDAAVVGPWEYLSRIKTAIRQDARLGDACRHLEPSN